MYSPLRRATPLTGGSQVPQPARLRPSNAWRIGCGRGVSQRKLVRDLRERG